MAKNSDSTIVRAQKALAGSPVARAKNAGDGPPVAGAKNAGAEPTSVVRTQSDEPARADRTFANPLCRSAARASPVSTETLDQSRIVAMNKANPVTAAIDLLRTKVLHEMRSKGWRTLGITSPMPHCGKTTLAINLAISIAGFVDKNVVLIDFDLRHSSVGKYLGIDSTPGIGNYLNGEVPFEATLVDTGIPRLLVVPNDAPTQNSSELLNTRKASILLKRLKNAGDVKVAIIDLPPTLPTDDTLALLPQLDCILMIAADGVTTKRELEDAQRALQRGNVLGTVLNKTSRAL
jgi:Mrp family chromosome partitioning ATPase